MKKQRGSQGSLTSHPSLYKAETVSKKKKKKKHDLASPCPRGLVRCHSVGVWCRAGDRAGGLRREAFKAPSCDLEWGRALREDKTHLSPPDVLRAIKSDAFLFQS